MKRFIRSYLYSQMQRDKANTHFYRPKSVLSGKWLYDGGTYLPVQIFAISYDYYYEIAKADDQLEDGEVANLNENGEQYMIAWHNGEFSEFGTKEFGGLTLDEAIVAAENKVAHKILWDYPT